MKILSDVPLMSVSVVDITGREVEVVKGSAKIQGGRPYWRGIYQGGDRLYDWNKTSIGRKMEIMLNAAREREYEINLYKLFSNIKFVLFFGKNVYPAYYGKADKVNSIIIVDFIGPAHHFYSFWTM